MAELGGFAGDPVQFSRTPGCPSIYISKAESLKAELDMSRIRQFYFIYMFCRCCKVLIPIQYGFINVEDANLFTISSILSAS